MKIIYKIKRFSNYFLEQKLYDDSENKKDSGFSWGKALGATALAAGTMYGAKKGAFGNTIQRGYNTAYGKLGNALGSKSMVDSAARDWAAGSVKKGNNSSMQYKRDLVNKQNEFKSQFNKPTNNETKTTTTQQNTNSNTQQKTSQNNTTTGSVMSTKPFVGPVNNNFGYNSANKDKINAAFNNGTITYGNNVKPAVVQNPSSSSSINNSSVINNQPSILSSSSTNSSASNNNKPFVSLKDLPNVEPKKKVQVFGIGNTEGERQRAIKNYNNQQQQRIALGQQRSGYSGTKKVKNPTMSRAEYDAMKARKRAENEARRAKNEENRVNRRRSSIEASIAGKEQQAVNDFYNNPNYGYMMNQVSFSNTRILKNQRFFSKKEDSSSKKKIKNAALLGAGAASLGALTVYGIKRGRNAKKKYKRVGKNS